MAMFKNKHMTFSLILVCLIVVSPMAKAQLGLGGGSGGLLGGLGGLLGGLGLGGLGGLVGGILNVVNINGVVFCSLNGALNGTSTPAFANAGVQLQCGRQNTVVSSTTTNAVGMFSLPTSTLQMLLSTLLSDCRIAVTTPLSTCNVNLPSVGNLVSKSTLIGSTLSGGLNIMNIVPTGFLPIN